MIKEVLLNKKPILMCYSYLANLFSLIPFVNEGSEPIFHIKSMNWHLKDQVMRY